MNEVEERKKIVEELKEKGINPYKYKYEITAHSIDIKSKYIDLKPDEITKDSYSLAGRVMVIRDMGKIVFSKLRDEFGDIQIVFNKAWDESSWKFFKDYVQAGDIVGVVGFVFRTKKGEISIGVKKLELLSKAIRPLPEKFHGLKDVEKRYRKRYLDFIVNLDSREKIKKRFMIINSIRKFLNKNGFIEVETPYLQKYYGGAEAEPFKTHFNFLDEDFYLSISPELYLKRLIIGGFEKVYHVARNFRNESVDSTHNPEFVMLEAYQAYADYRDMMELVENLIKVSAKSIGIERVNFRGKEIDLRKFEKISMREALLREGIDINEIKDEELSKKVDELEIPESKKKLAKISRGKMILTLFDELVQPKLINPTIVYDYPIDVCPLTKPSRKGNRYAERFELFIGGMEIANSYSELNDPEIQRKNFEEQEKLRKLDKEIPPKDWEFVEAMEYGMPPTGGLGLGIDRIVMVLTGSDSIKEVIPFPFVK